MNKFIITTDSTSDLPADIINEYSINIIPLFYKLDDEVYGGQKDLDPSEFYDRMRKGQMPTTMACNNDSVEACFKPFLDQGYDILHIAFSSALSSSYNSAAVAGKELSYSYPNQKIYVIDSLSASLGEGLLVYKACKMKENGNTIEEIYNWIENNKLHLCHQFTVDDLFHLHRGGRVSKATAIIGTIINVKPVLHVNDLGELISLSNVRGRKKALNHIVDNMLEAIKDFDDPNEDIFISHGDSLDDAKYVADRVTKLLGPKHIVINYVSPTIGAHSGPGTIALFFMGKKR